MQNKILVVDDEPKLERLIRQRFRKKIRNKEYEFVFAFNGFEALEKLEQEDDINIVLSDINMPQMDGLTLLAKLDEINPALKTVMVSAYGDIKNIRTAMNHGAYDFVTKPINFADLEITIQKTLKEIEALKLAALASEELRYIEQELSVAGTLQQSMLPKDFSIFPDNSNWEIYAEMIPAKEIGGDFYDFFLIDDNRLGFVTGDVSGKGMPAALFMAISRTLIRSTALLGGSTGDCLNQVNYLLSQDNSRAMFVMLFYGILNLQTGELEYTNGGYNPPCLVSADGQLKFLEKNDNIALGVKEDFEYQSNKFVLERGSSLVLYTGGLADVTNKDSNKFSNERLKKYLQKTADISAPDIIQGMLNEIKTFVGSVQQSDDITTMVIKRN